VGDECLIGMGAIVLDGVVLGARCLVGAGALLTGGKSYPEGSLILGSPARLVRVLSPEEQADLPHWAIKYLPVARAHSQLQRQCIKG
jgi:carbonic anhydrase/acetyltransferase-like protein (isoleucine patch superfamily)